jgi:nitroimidazol reductase NimA-like FMN-containing flavoprotein (pyridoxamine 5'-phosphate oxidase superfamily)
MATEPTPSRPYMPDYGISEGRDGLLSWTWAEQQLRHSKNFWLATRWPDGRPHVMPVWAVWDGEAIWFSGGLHSRKVQNVLVDDRCSISTEDAYNPLVVEGVAVKVDDDTERQRFVDRTNEKYETEYGLDFFDPSTTAVLRIEPRWAFGLREDDFTTSPTRWRFAR